MKDAKACPRGTINVDGKCIPSTSQRGFTGKIFIRKAGKFDNKNLIYIVGILGGNVTNIQDEALHIVTGIVTDNQLTLSTTGDIEDVREVVRGQGASGILSEPFWQI